MGRSEERPATGKFRALSRFKDRNILAKQQSDVGCQGAAGANGRANTESQDSLDESCLASYNVDAITRSAVTEATSLDAHTAESFKYLHFFEGSLSWPH